MKFASGALVALATSLAPHRTSAQACGASSGYGFTLSFKGHCTYENVLESYEGYFGGLDGSCPRTAEQDLHVLLDAAEAYEAVQVVADLCGGAFDEARKIDFYSIARKGQDMSFEKDYFDGDTYWNQETETIYPRNADGGPTNKLSEDTARVDHFHDQVAQTVHVDWPDSLTNFNPDTCTTNAAMCCWPRDRQANDNNGNCATAYDERCVDKGPSDNTDLCHVDLARGVSSTNFGSTGTAIFYADDGNVNDGDADGEGRIHCHGLAWANDDNDFTSRYKGNNLFYVSMYDHMHVRGYVENIAGAPMCACVEQMPVVSRSDCTQIDVDEEFEFVYSVGSGFKATLTDLKIDFNACRGIYNQNNDLWAYMGRLYREKKVTSDQYAALSRVLVEDRNCNHATRYHMAQEGYVQGYVHDDTQWTQVAGKGVFSSPSYGKEAFKTAFGWSANGIVRRTCATCDLSHQNIYYKRLTPVNDTTDLLNELKNERNQHPNNVHGVDFELYSTYEDAVAQTNAWDCDYNHGDYFPGNCDPNGENRDQDGRFNTPSGQPDLAFYVEASETNSFLTLDSADVGAVQLAGAVRDYDEVLYQTASGGDIWGDDDDEFNFHSEEVTGDIVASVKVTSLDFRNYWTKAGIMLRSNFQGNSTNFGIFATGQGGVRMQDRQDEHGWTSGYAGSSNVGTGMTVPIWFMVSREGSMFTAYTSEDGSDWKVFGNRNMPDMADTLHLGLALTSHWDGYVAEAVYENYAVSPAPTDPPTSSPAPTSVYTESVDVGNDVDGSANMIGTAGDAFTVTAKGNDIWGTSDRFHYVQANKTNTESMTLIARVHSQVFTNSWSKHGLMIRETLETGSRYFAALLAYNKGPISQWRLGDVNEDGSYKPTNSNYGGGNWNSNEDTAWLKVEKVGNTYTGYKGVENHFVTGGVVWNQITAPVEVNMTGTELYVGLATCSHQWDQYATVDFREYSFSDTAVSSARKLRGA